MQSSEVEALREELRRREGVLREVDGRLARELERQAVLEELYGDSSREQSEASGSRLEESSISEVQSGVDSVSSSFLKRELRNVYEFGGLGREEKEVSETRMKTQLIDTRENARRERNRDISDHVQREDGYSTFFRQTAHEEDIAELMSREKWLLRRKEEESERKRDLARFLEAKEKRRLETIDQERLQVRESLLKEQNLARNNVQHLREELKLVSFNFQIPNQQILETERKAALTKLLKQVRHGRREADRLINRAKAYSFK